MAKDAGTRVREIALATITISGVTLAIAAEDLFRTRPAYGDLLQFSYGLNRTIIAPVSVLWLASGVGLLLRWNWARWTMMALCAITIVAVGLMLIPEAIMPSGATDGQSALGLRVLQVMIMLLTAVPGVICFRWMQFLHQSEAQNLFRTRPTIEAARQ